MKIIDLLKKSKWWFFSGTIISILIIISHIFTYNLLVFFMVCLLASFISELLIKSKSWFSLFVGEFFIGIYIGMIYFLIGWIGYEVIIKQAWKDPMYEFNGAFVIALPIVITVIAIIPGILSGGFIARLIRVCINRIK